MSFYIVKVPSTFCVGGPTVLPTSYTADNEDGARSDARRHARDPRNITTRIDSTGYVAAIFVVLEAPSHAAAQAQADLIKKPAQPVIYLGE